MTREQAAPRPRVRGTWSDPAPPTPCRGRRRQPRVARQSCVATSGASTHHPPANAYGGRRCLAGHCRGGGAAGRPAGTIAHRRVTRGGRGGGLQRARGTTGRSSSPGGVPRRDLPIGAWPRADSLSVCTVHIRTHVVADIRHAGARARRAIAGGQMQKSQGKLSHVGVDGVVRVATRAYLATALCTYWPMSAR